MMQKEAIEADLYKLYTELDLRNLLDQLAEKICYHLGCEEAAIFLYNPDKEELYFESATGEKGEILKQITLKKGEGIAGWVAEMHQSLSIPDCSTDHRFSTRSDLRSSFHTRSVIAAPVMIDNTLIGVIEGINKRKEIQPIQDETILTIIAGFTAVPLHNALLFHRLARETSEKDLLLQLARGITAATRLEDIFPLLNRLITSQADALTISFSLTRSPGNTRQDTILSINSSTTSHHSYRFDFISEKKRTGSLDITCSHMLTDSAHTLFSGLAGFLSLMIDRLEMQEERIRTEKIEKELEIARNIQQSFLIPTPPDIPGMECGFINIPSSKVGGDYYDLKVLPGQRLLFTVADIAGHGIPASLLMSIYHTSFRYQAPRDDSIDVMITKINDIIAETTDPSQYLTAFCGFLDQDKTLHYINAGHPSALLLRKGDAMKLESNNMTIGMFPAISFSSQPMLLQSGDLLLVYTDGVIETENESGEQFGLHRCIDILKKNNDLSLQQLQDHLLTSLRTFQGGEPFEDDITLVLFRITAGLSSSYTT